MKIGGIVNPDGGLCFFTFPVSDFFVEGSLRVKGDGQIVEGSFSFALQQLCEHAAELLDAEGLKQLSTLLKNNNIEGQQVFWGEKVIRGQITIHGVDLSLKKQTFDVEGSQHSSTFEYDDAGNVTHYCGTTEVTSGTVSRIGLDLELFCFPSHVWQVLVLPLYSLSAAKPLYLIGSQLPDVR